MFMGCCLKMKKQKVYYKISVNREKCNGCGICAKACSSNWHILEDKKAHVIKFKITKLGCNLDAMKACPKNAISIKKQK